MKNTDYQTYATPGALLMFVGRDGRITDMLHGDIILVIGPISDESNLIEVLRLRQNHKMWWAESNLASLCDVLDV